jgi:hypothetical protein
VGIERVYQTPIENVSIGTAVQDIFSLLASSGHGVILHQIHLEATSTAAAALRMRLKRGTATVTQGSGGTNVTPVITNANNSKAAGTVSHINDTTQATTSGAFTTMIGFNWDTVLPFDHLPAPEDRESCDVSQALILDLPTTITAVTISGYIKWHEEP